MLLLYSLENKNQNYIIKLAVGTSLYDITPTGRILNLLLSGGDIMKDLMLLVLKWILRCLLKKRPQSSKIEISIDIKIHKD